MPVVEIKVPEVGESITEVTIAQWLVEEGDYVEKDQIVVELDSDKATLEMPIEESGTISFAAQEGDDIDVGAVICKVDTDAKKPEGFESNAESKDTEVVEEAVEATAATAPAEKAENTSYAKGHASPVAAKMIAENDLDQATIKGTGRDGRITKEDVVQALKSKPQNGNGKHAGTGGKSVFEAGNYSRETRTEKMSKLRRTIAKRLVGAKNDTAMLTTFNEVDMGPVMDLRSQYKEKFKETHGVNLGFMSFFARAACVALQQFPQVNAILNEEELTFHDYCDIGIAVSTPRGLVVPVIRNAESLSMAEIEQKVVELATKGRDNKLSLEEMTGGTFTLSNGGVFGSLMSTPILNAPQSAILGMHKIEERPVVVDGEIVIRRMMYLALSYDHRVIDGKESVSFLVKIKEMLEHPEFMLHGDNPGKLLLGL